MRTCQAFTASRGAGGGARRFRSSVILDNDDVLVVSKPVGPFQMVSGGGRGCERGVLSVCVG